MNHHFSLLFLPRHYARGAGFCLLMAWLAAWASPAAAQDDYEVHAELRLDSSGLFVDVYLKQNHTDPYNTAQIRVVLRFLGGRQCFGTGGQPWLTSGSDMAVAGATNPYFGSNYSLLAQLRRPTNAADTTIWLTFNLEDQYMALPSTMTLVSSVPIETQDCGCTTTNSLALGSLQIYEDEDPPFNIVTTYSQTVDFTTGSSVAVSNSITRTLPTAALPSPVPPGTPIQLESLIGGRWVLSSASRGPDTLAWPTDSVRFFAFSETGAGPENQRIYLRDFRGCLDSFDIANVAPSRKLAAAAWLEGPYDPAADTMVAALNPTPGMGGQHLLDDRYLHSAATVGWQGQEMPQGATVPSTAIDIVRLDLRTSNDPDDQVGTAYGWLLSDGRIVDFASGGCLPFLNFPGDDTDMPADSHRVVFRHRTHLALITKTNRYTPFDTLGIGTANFRDTSFIYASGNPSTWAVKLDGTNALAPCGSVFNEETVLAWTGDQVNAQDWGTVVAASDYGTSLECQLEGAAPPSCTDYSGANPVNVYDSHVYTGGPYTTRAHLDVNLDGIVNCVDEDLTEANNDLNYPSYVVDYE